MLVVRRKAAVAWMTTDTKLLALRPGETVVVAGVGVEGGLPAFVVPGSRCPPRDPARVVQPDQDSRRIRRDPGCCRPLLDGDLEEQLPFAPDAGSNRIVETV